MLAVPLLALALTAGPHLDRVFEMRLRGERIGAVHVTFDGERYRYESISVVRRGSTRSTTTSGCSTDAQGVGRTDDGRALPGPTPSTLALFQFRDGDTHRCIEVEDERDGKRGQVCATRVGRRLAGTLMGEPFTTSLDEVGPVALELPGQQMEFQLAAGPLPPPDPKDLFAGSSKAGALAALEGAQRASVSSAGACAVKLQLERRSPPHDEPLPAIPVTRWGAVARELNLGTRTRWATAVALARFVEQGIQGVEASDADEDAAKVWAQRRASCVGQARLFVELARGLGVPSRLVYGALVEDGTVAPHAWAEVEIASAWYGVDPSRGAAPIGPEHLPLARETDADPLRAGRCLLELPQQRWTVDAR